MKNCFIAFFLILVFPMVTVAQESTPQHLTSPALMGEQQAEAQKFCDQLFAVYQNYSHNAFMDLIAEGMVPPKLEFINTVEENLSGKTILSLTGDVIFVLPQGVHQVVQLQWEKKYQAKDASEPKVETGTSMLVLSKENETWKLLRVSGNNLF